MKKLLCAVIIIAMMFAACACAQTADPIVPEITDEDLYAVEVEEEHWPVIEGTAAFLPYYTAAAARMLDTGEAEASRSVLCTVSDLAYSDLIFGSADLIFCFLPNEQQVRLADAEGVTLACYPVLNEAFVFFVTPDNPVDSLTAQQLRDVYTGAATNWSELGGNDVSIVPFYRPEGFSDFAGLTAFVADSASLVPAPVQTKEGSMGESAEVAANFDGSAGAIGCGYLSAVLQQYKDTDLKILAVDGCEASAANIQSGAYPFISQACAVIRGGEEESPAGQLAQWCAWPLGQALAAEKGYVPNMEVDAKPAEEILSDREGKIPEGGWAEGNASAGSARPEDNRLQPDLTILTDTDALYADCLTVRGLKDKKIEDAANAKIRSLVESFCAEDYLPDAQGIRAALDRGLKSGNCVYKYVHTQMTANSGNVLSVAVVCRSRFAPPGTEKTSSAGTSFTDCRTLNLDLNTGKEIPITAFVEGGADALSCLDGLTKQYLYENANEVYMDDGYSGHPEGLAETEVKITRFPGLAKDQKYYLDDKEHTLFLVLDVNTPWAITGYDYSCLPLIPGGQAAFDRFLSRESLFE